MLQEFITALKTNEIAQAAVIGPMAATLMYSTLKGIPLKLWRSIKHLVTYDLMFRSDGPEYYYVNRFVCENVINDKWSRDFTYDTVEVYTDDGDNNKLYSGVSIGYGKHWGMYQGTPVIVYREMVEENHGSEFRETMYLSFLGRSNKPAKAFAAEIDRLFRQDTKDDRIQFRTSSGSCWQTHMPRSARGMNTVMLNGNQSQTLLDFIEKFQGSKRACLDKGLPWHTGIMLSGPPGTGKSSLIHAVASATGRSVAFLNLSSVGDDGELMDLMACRNKWDTTILVIEDIDVARASVTRDDKDGTVTLSTLLNVLDGFLTPEGLLVMATTNSIESLDPALLRPGRFDLTLELGPLQVGAARRMAGLLLGPDNDYDFTGYRPVVGSELRERLLRNT